jgi:NAD(P)-dependent dehydrogenase (short-subunit alcohol dehydrogenase family)
METVAFCAGNTSINDRFHQKFQADLADEAATRQLASEVIEGIGRLDAVVNSAALFEHDGPQSFGYAAMQKHLASNTGAAIVLAQALHAHLLAAGAQAGAGRRGVVVNLLDQKLWNQNPDFLSYTLSKAALEAAGTMLAIGLAPLVRVVGVAPGLTLTSHLLDDAQFQALHKLSPLGRSSTPQDVCAAVLFALTNSSITGTTLLVDGGQHLMKFERDFSLM